MPAKREWVRDLPDAAADWLRALPFSLRIPAYGITIVHAGIVPDVRPKSTCWDCLDFFGAAAGIDIRREVVVC